MNPAVEIFSSGDIYIEDDRIIAAEDAVSIPPASTPEVIDGRGKIAIPGFISAHHHLFQSLLRGLQPNSRLPEWLSGCILPIGPRLSPDDLYWAVRLSLAECIESGVTSIVDWAYNLHSAEHAAATLTAMRDSGARVHFAYGPSMAKGWGDFDVRLGEFEQIRADYFGGRNQDGRIRLWLGLGGPELQDEGAFREQFAYARRQQLHVHMHLRELELLEPKDAVARLDRWGLLGPDLLLAHAVDLREDDPEILAQSGTKVSYNPLSNMRLGHGICRAVELRQHGVGVALGLDGAASNDNNDYFTLMRAALGLQRARLLRADCITPDDILQMATAEGAGCLGDDGAGIIAPGKKADLLLIDPNTLNLTPLNNFVAQLVFCAQPRNVDTVIIDGCILKRDGGLVNTDIDEIMARCRIISRRLLTEAGVAHSPVIIN
ncbi:MAG: amidohydrolase family protein [Candidatus Binataceae bacterium]